MRAWSRRRWLALSVAVALVGLVWALVATRDVEDALGDDVAIRTAAATVERGDLTRTIEAPGVLGFGARRTIVAQTVGTLTWMAVEGSVAGSGDTLVRIDERPVVVLRGDVPAYRPLSVSSSPGADVAQLEAALAGLGLFEGRPDDRFDSSTSRAVERLQDRVGAEVTGRVELGSIVFVTGPRRVAEHLLPVGSPVAPGTPLVAVTGARAVVSFSVDATERARLEPGMVVTIELADGSTAEAKVRTIDPVATVTADSAGRPSEPMFDVEAGVDRSGEVVAARVTVRLVERAASDVLHVPVAALVALAEGGHAVEIIDPTGTTRLVAVELGVFVEGRVEVSGDLDEADRVVVPRR